MKFGEMLETLIANSHGKIATGVLARYRHRLDEGSIEIGEKNDLVSMREGVAFEEAWDEVLQRFRPTIR